MNEMCTDDVTVETSDEHELLINTQHLTLAGSSDNINTHDSIEATQISHNNNGNNNILPLELLSFILT